MIHWKARRLLAALPDGTLPAETERTVRAHLAECARCQRRMGEFELSESLMRRLPASILPLKTSPTSYPRLARLAAWSAEPDWPQPERWRAPALGVAGGLAAVFLFVTVGAWSPVLAETSSPVTLAYVPADSLTLSAAWRPGR